MLGAAGRCIQPSGPCGPCPLANRDVPRQPGSDPSACLPYLSCQDQAEVVVPQKQVVGYRAGSLGAPERM